MRRTLRILGIAAVGVAFAFAVSTPAVTLAGPAAADDPTDSDAVMYARDNRVSVAVARARLADQAALGDYAARLEQRFVDQVAGIWIEHSPQYRLVVRLTAGSAEVIQRADARALPHAVDTTPVVVRDDATHSLAQVQAELERLSAQLDRVPGTTPEIDVHTGEIVVFAPNTPALADARSSTLSRASANAVPIRFQLRAASGSDLNIHGGKYITRCTSGFTVIHNATGARGFITAGHCDDTPTYYQTSTITFATVHRGEIRDARRDVQFNVAPNGGGVYPRFYASSDTTPRDLLGSRGRDQQVIDSYVCHRGRTTGFSCGYLRSRTSRPSYSGACPGVCASTWMRIDGPSLACANGDSGGPVFDGNVALGILKGGGTNGTQPGDCVEAWYMAINYASDLGVSTLRAN